MRLISTSDDQKRAYRLSTFLKSQGIDNQLEIITNTDWGSSDYGNVTARLWVLDEDQVEEAQKITHDFEQNPEDARFRVGGQQKESLFEPIQTKLKEGPARLIKISKTKAVEPQPLGIATLYILMICSLIFLISLFTTPQIETPPKNIPFTPLYSPAINKYLMFDYPKAYEIIDKLVRAYGIGKLQNPEELPPAGKQLLQQFYNTPYWQGFYDQLLSDLKHQPNPSKNAPLFEKIREGQFWRLFTPCLLHYDIFHIFFNMIWLIVLGKQMEERLKIPRYLLFILVTGIFSNVIQYLMGGANFIGFSGILCAMLTFIWVRQKRAAWEGYHLQSGAMGFIIFFILGMFSLQMISFFLEIYANTSFSPGIANAAHLSGLFAGAVLGRLNFFAVKPH